MRGTFSMAFAMTAVLLVLFMKRFGLTERMTVTGPDKANGGDGEEAGKEGLH